MIMSIIAFITEKVVIIGAEVSGITNPMESTTAEYVRTSILNSDLKILELNRTAIDLSLIYSHKKDFICKRSIDICLELTNEDILLLYYLYNNNSKKKNHEKSS